MKFIYVLFFSVVNLTVVAQTLIEGSVKDKSGLAVPGANIFIKDSYDGTSSGANGLFNFSTDEKGEHSLQVTFIGFKTFERKVLLKGISLRLDVVLEEEVNQLDAVVVSAGSFTAGEEKRRTILKAVDIATTAGATADIAGALNTLPGTQKVGESGRLFVRGGDGSETRTFIDGMAVLDAYAPSAPSTPSRGRFLPFMFKGTSFSTGGYSAEYGQALSSALVLNSKDIADMNQTDIGILSVGADVAHTQAWERASLSGKIGYTNIRPYFRMINQEVDWKTPPASIEGSGAYRQKIGKDGMIKFFGNFNNTSFALFNHDILDPSIKQQYDLKNNYRYGNASYQQSLNPTWSVRSGLSYSYNKNAIEIEGLPMSELENGLHGKLVFENSINNQLEVRMGGEIIQRSYEAVRYNATMQENESLAFDEPLSVAFTEAEYYANNYFVIKAGGRAEHNGLTDKLGVDPRISLAYKPGKHGQFSFAYGTFRQTAQNQYVRWNTKLNSEKAEHVILNYQLLTDRKTFRIEAYHKKYSQLVKFENGNPLITNNEGSGYANGIELFWRDSETIKNADYWVSYSFLDTKRDYLNYPIAAAPSFASAHNLSIVYKHFIPKLKSQLGFTYSYSSGRRYYNPNKPASEFNSDSTPSYHDISVNVSYLPKSNLIIYASCTNLLGRDNIFGYQYSATTNAQGEYVNRAVRQAAPRFLFLGVFITISKNKSINQLPNL
jgi:hypothetical protein